MNYFAKLPAPEGRNSLIDFSPVNNALSEVRDQNNANRNALMKTEEQTYQRGRDAKQDARVEQQDMRQQVQLFGKRAEAIDQIQDPAQRQALWGKIIASHPNRAALTPEYLDPMNGPKLVMAEAGQWRDPRDSQIKDLEIEKTRAEIGDINARASTRGQTSGDARAITRGAPSGYAWNDPNDPGKGVARIPGYEQTIPGEVAGKVAMMNMARNRIESSRAVFERDWGASDLAKWGAGNIPLIGDISAASGDVGIAQRDIRTGIEAALRTMTGAAAPEQEVERYMQMFMPNPKDTKESSKQKIDGLMKFMDDANALVMQGRGQPSAASSPQPQAQPQPQQAAPQAAPRSPEEYQRLPPGTVYTAPDGSRRTKQ